MTGRRYTLRGEVLTVVAAPPKIADVRAAGFDVPKGTRFKRNVLVERPDGTRFVRPARGLTRLDEAAAT